MMDEGLSDDVPIYRVFNIYDLITTIETRQLRLSQARGMQDKNELLGEYLLTLNTVFGPESDFANRTRLDQHQQSQSAHYMTCWTRSPDNIAVWSLYSPSCEGILVSSTVGKLRAALGAFYKAHNYGIAYTLDPDDKHDLFFPPTVGPVQYVDFSELLKRLAEIREGYRKRIDVAASDNAQLSADAIGEAMTWRAERSESVVAELGLSGKGASLLKDSRYEHEKEVRAAICLVRRDHRTKEDYLQHPLAGWYDPVHVPSAEECPANIFVPVDPRFIQGLQMDGRLPAWRRAAVQTLFGKFGFDIVSSTAFASTPDREDWRRNMSELFA